MQTADVMDGASTGETAAGDEVEGAAVVQTANEAGTPRKKERPAPLTSKEQDAIAAKAESDFKKNFTGSHLDLDTVLHNHTVIRAFRRTWFPVARNVNTALTVLRTVLKDNTAAVALEQEILGVINEKKADVESKIKQLDAVLSQMGDDAKLAQEGLAAKNPLKTKFMCVGPVGHSYRALMLKCDALIDRATVAYTIGEIDPNENQKILLLVKRTLGAIDSASRTRRERVLQLSRDAGKTRPGYKTDKDDAEPESKIPAIAGDGSEGGELTVA